MRLFIIALTILSMCFYGCKNTQKSSHEHETAEEHAAHNHDHEHENHDHEHEGHNHEEEEHENGEGHSDEIIFTKAQAAKTDFEVKEIQPGTFHQIIKTTGQVLPAPGDESIIVATNNGVISYANNNQAEGSMVKQGQPLFYITSKHMGEGDYYTRIHANYEKAKAEYERAEKLVKDQIVSQKEFENAFPYSETDDQLRSAAEIKRDMEKEKPMDRLLVGDVGYGKTEVALRAAF